MRANPSQRHLILFARFPQVGRGKRRLAADLGDGPAHRWSRMQLGDTYRRLYAPGRWRLVLALEGAPSRWRAPLGLDWLDQGHLAGGRKALGRRMLASLAAFAPGPTLLIGSDILDVQAQDIAQLFAALERPGSLLAPAADGGFWAIGHRGPALAGSVLDQVAWSRSDTCAATAQALKARLVPLVKQDVDCAADLPQWV